MKNLRKIIILFLFIFLAGIVVTALSINTTLNKKEPSKNLKTKQDTVYLIKKNKKLA
ncbi:conserved hypothetical protein [Tenacibaculum sp. 190524A05c]|uniref:Uncharacterized protein n=1 Tax=Tenacibaculum platacis TaxID=3137852 RepID=A0ABP1EII8_9FLAO